MAKKGDWVLIHDIVLNSNERASQIPEETKAVPLEMWVKGFLKDEAQIGDNVEVTTITGRSVKGKLIEVNPTYKHGFGNFSPEVLRIGLDLRRILGGDDVE